MLLHLSSLLLTVLEQHLYQLNHLNQDIALTERQFTILFRLRAATAVVVGVRGTVFNPQRFFGRKCESQQSRLYFPLSINIDGAVSRLNVTFETCSLVCCPSIVRAHSVSIVSSVGDDVSSEQTVEKTVRTSMFVWIYSYYYYDSR